MSTSKNTCMLKVTLAATYIKDFVNSALWNDIQVTLPAQDDMSISALEGKAADASAGLRSKVGHSSHLAGEVHRKAWAKRTGHIRIDLCQVQNA